MMFEDPKHFVETWKSDQKRKPRRNIGKIVLLSIAGALVVFLLFIGFYSLSDLINKPVEKINSLSASGDWAMFGRDFSRSANSSSDLGVLKGNVTTILDAGASLGSSPVGLNGLIYVGSRNGKFYAIDELTGKVRWELQTGSWVDSSPAIVNNVVYVGSNDGKLYALKAQTGEIIWTYDARFGIRSSPAVADGKVYFGGDDFAVHCVDAVTGKGIWRVEAGNAVISSPVVANGIVLVGSTSGNFYCLDARSGRMRLNAPTGKTITSSPAVTDKTAYFMTISGNLYAMNITAKNWLWENKLRPYWQTLQVYGVAPAAPSPSGLLWTYQLGEVSWTSTPNTSSSPILAGDAIVVGVEENLISFNPSKQIRNWVFSREDTFTSVPVLAGDSLVAAGESGHLYILNTKTGKLKQEITVGGRIITQPLVLGQTIYITSEDGKLYAVK